MKRHATIFAALLSMIMGSSVYAQTPPKNEAEAPEIQECVNKHLPNVKSRDKKERDEALRGLRNELMTLWNTKHKSPRQSTRRKLARELVALYRSTTDKDFEIPRERLFILSTIASNGDDGIAKSFLMEVLEKGTDQERNAILSWLGGPKGVGGDDVYNTIETLIKRGVIEQKARWSLTARLNKDRALPAIHQEVDSTEDKETFIHAVTALQDYYRKPEYMKRILPRFIELGLDKDGSFQGDDGLFAINSELLVAYLEMTTGQDARLPLRLIAEHGLLRFPDLSKPIATIQRKLADADPEARIWAARAMVRAAGYHPGKTDAIRGTLNVALQKEGAPEVRAAIQEAIETIQRRDADWEKMLKRIGREAQK